MRAGDTSEPTHLADVNDVKGLYHFFVALLRPFFALWTRTTMTGTAYLPKKGGFIVSTNHISSTDPFCLAIAIAKTGHAVRHLTKAQLFRIPVIGPLFGRIGLIPVERHSSHSADVLAAVREAIESGRCIGIYPEGTLTKDPGYWPMKIKTGAARVALDTRCPIVPVAQWGPQDLLSRYSKMPDLLRRHPVRVKIMEPLDLSDLYSDEGSSNHDAVQEATRRLQAAITAGVEELRGEKAPEQPWDPYNTDAPSKAEIVQMDKKRKNDQKKHKGETR